MLTAFVLTLLCSAGCCVADLQTRCAAISDPTFDWYNSWNRGLTFKQDEQKFYIFYEDQVMAVELHDFLTNRIFSVQELGEKAALRQPQRHSGIYWSSGNTFRFTNSSGYVQYDYLADRVTHLIDGGTLALPDGAAVEFSKSYASAALGGVAVHYEQYRHPNGSRYTRQLSRIDGRLMAIGLQNTGSTENDPQSPQLLAIFDKTGDRLQIVAAYGAIFGIFETTAQALQAATDKLLAPSADIDWKSTALWFGCAADLCVDATLDAAHYDAPSGDYEFYAGHWRWLFKNGQVLPAAVYGVNRPTAADGVHFTDSGLSAVFTSAGAQYHIFDNGSYTLQTGSAVDRFDNISAIWRRAFKKIDAALVDENGQVVFFAGSFYQTVAVAGGVASAPELTQSHFFQCDDAIYAQAFAILNVTTSGQFNVYKMMFTPEVTQSMITSDRTTVQMTATTGKKISGKIIAAIVVVVVASVVALVVLIYCLVNGKRKWSNGEESTHPIDNYPTIQTVPSESKLRPKTKAQTGKPSSAMKRKK